MKNLKRMACLMGLAMLLVLPGAAPIRADRDDRGRLTQIMPNPFGTPGRTGVLRPGPVPSGPSIQRRRTFRRDERRQNRRWHNRGWYPRHNGHSPGYWRWYR